MGVIPVEPNKPVYLNLQLEDGEINLPKIVKAILRDHLGQQLTELTLSHVGGGLFKNSSYLMPDLAFITSQYVVYQADGITADTSYSIEIDTFQQMVGGSGPDASSVIFIGKEYKLEVDSNV